MVKRGSKKQGTTADSKPKAAAALNGASWVWSDARHKVANDVIAGKIPLDGQITEAIAEKLYYELGYDTNPLFKNFPLRPDLYMNRIISVQQAIGKMKYWADFDDAALKADRKRNPVQPRNVRGELRWDGSKAQSTLQEDLAAGNYTKHDPEALYKRPDRPEYRVFSKEVFRKHVQQAIQNKKKYKKERRRVKGHYGKKELEPNPTSTQSSK